MRVYGDEDVARWLSPAMQRVEDLPQMRRLLADWDRQAGELTVRANFQGPFSLHPVLCAALGLDPSRVRLIVPDDIGGSFGIKAMIYPYIALAAVASRFAGSPVVWLEDRQEHFYGSASGTNRVTRVEAAVTEDGVVLGLRYRILEDVGAYLRAPEPSCVMRSLTMFAGPYRVPLAVSNGKSAASIRLRRRTSSGSRPSSRATLSITRSSVKMCCWPP